MWISFYFLKSLFHLLSLFDVRFGGHNVANYVTRSRPEYAHRFTSLSGDTVSLAYIRNKIPTVQPQPRLDALGSKPKNLCIVHFEIMDGSYPPSIVHFTSSQTAK